MSKLSSKALGSQSIGSLLIKQALPASVGILVMSLNILVDTIFVGNWIGTTAIAAINIVLPVSFFIAALGMAIGVGGSSVLSRALGAGKSEKALQTFGNQITLNLKSYGVFSCFWINFSISNNTSFGGKGNIFSLAKIYYVIVLYGVPILALCMMGNTVIRAEGKPKYAMYAMLIPSVSNLFLDYIFIKVFQFGMYGAAWATTGSYFLSFVFILWFFLSGRTELKLKLNHFIPVYALVKEISSLGFVTLSRQAMVSITYLLMNNILFGLGGETLVVVYAIIARMLMFSLFPVYGITQGFLPIAGYNYGASLIGRVKQTINTAIIYATLLASVVFIFLMVFPEPITLLFTNDTLVLSKAPSAMRWVFAATPIIAIQLIGAAYFQAVGKAKPALLLTLSRQGFFFIPLILILPKFYGELGVWISFPISDVLSTLITAYF